MGTPILNRRLARSVEASTATANGTLSGNACVLRGLQYTAGTTSGSAMGSITLKDGGSGGTTKLTVNVAGDGTSGEVRLPAGGMEFDTDMYVELSSVDSVTAFFHR